MEVKKAIIPVGHPNRLGWKLEAMNGYTLHSTANLWPGAGDEWHAKYFAREFVMIDKVAYEKDGKTKFRIASTHAIADSDSVTEDLPLDEFAAGSGDRQFAYTDNLKGQTSFAKYAYGNRQNWRSLQIEVCENKDGNWAMALSNACEWVIQHAKANGYVIDVEGSKHPGAVLAPPPKGTVFISRHFDLTGKNCPSRLVSDTRAWFDVVDYIAKYVNG